MSLKSSTSRKHAVYSTKICGKMTSEIKDFVRGKKIIPLVQRTIGKSTFESHRLIKKGFDIESLDTLKSVLLLSNHEIADIAGISESKLHRKRKANEALSPEESDRIYRVIAVIKQAIETFDGLEGAAIEWLTSPQFGLGGNVPLDLLKTDAGTQEVRNLLGRIEYGVYS